jgi:hypothetical protein
MDQLVASWNNVVIGDASRRILSQSIAWTQKKIENAVDIVVPFWPAV